jgi:hypothetical protein
MRFIINLIPLVLVSIAAAGFPVPQIEFAPRHYICYRAETPPVIDGKPDDRAWQQTHWSDTFVDIEGNLKPLPYLETRVKMLWDDEYLYFAAYLKDPHVWAKLTQRDTVIFYDNDFEIFIDPDGDTHNYYEFEINAHGTGWDLLLLKPYRDQAQVAVDSWDIAGLRSAVSIDGTLNDPSDADKGWSVEVAIPWQVLSECADRPMPRPGDQWRLNFSRVQWETDIVDGRYVKKKQREHNWVWSPQGLIAMHYPEMWGYLQFSAQIAGQGTDSFIRHDSEQAKWALRKIYYAQRKYKEQKNVYSDDLSLLNINKSEFTGFAALPEIKLTFSGYQARLRLKDDVRTVLIREDGKVWIEQ